MIVTLALIFAVAICCIIGFFKGLDEKRQQKEEERINLDQKKVEAKPRDPKTGRFVKKEEKQDA